MIEQLTQKFKHLSLRSLTMIGSTITVILFLVCYFSFKVFWKHEQDVQQSFERQMFEVERVETVLQMEELELRASIEDYAAWTTLANYVEVPSEQFIQESIGPHAFVSALIDSAIIFSPSGELIWNGTFDGEHVISRPIVDLNDPKVVENILSSAKQAPSDYINSFVRYARIKDSAAMVASSRICLSDAQHCDKGYLVFVRKIRDEFIQQLELATGVDIRVLPRSHSSAPIVNTHVLNFEDILSDNMIKIEVSHNEKMPDFFSWQGVAAVTAFSVIMFVVNLLVMNFFIKPFIKSQRALRQFHQSGGQLPSEDNFISKEARDFARQLNRLIAELEDSRAQLKQQSTIDPLTGIANRRYLYDSAKEYIETLRYRYISVVIVDIDHFKLYNDSYGHIAGDKALNQIAQTLKQAPTQYEHLVARYGGEEFCIVLACDSPIEIEPYVSSLVTSVQQLNIENSQSPTAECVTISVGATSGQIERYHQLSALIQFADRALYQVKDTGRNNYKIAPKHELSPV
ncbi:GGDEF family protein [Vibrio brasiliensis LMG 20546]|uniref:diguanylate cyclase n=2 Tax=Vibrio brasiliensis TaxID=170652 RepID=E8LWH1_9VIBR|nr:GGDEF family protein [Vibrio brasiliensis LMG 20546]